MTESQREILMMVVVGYQAGRVHSASVAAAGSWIVEAQQAGRVLDK